MVDILDDQGRLVWSFEHTLAWKLFSPETARWLVRHTLGSLATLILNLCFALFYGSVLILGMVQVGIGQDVFLLGMASLYVHLSLLGLLILDLNLTYLLMRRLFFWTELVVTTSGGLMLATLVGLDYRVAVAPIAFIIFFVALCIDASPTIMRHYVALPFAGGLFILVSATGLTLNLGRFPGQRNVTFSIGNVFGAAAHDMQYDVLSLCSSTLLAMVWVSLYMMSGAYRGRRCGEMNTLSIPLICVDAPGTNDVINPNLSKMFPWLREGERKGIGDVDELVVNSTQSTQIVSPGEVLSGDASRRTISA